MGALEAIFLLDITTAGRYLEHLFLIQVAKQLDHATNSHSNNKLNKIGTAEPTSGTTSWPQEENSKYPLYDGAQKHTGYDSGIIARAATTYTTLAATASNITKGQPGGAAQEQQQHINKSGRNCLCPKCHRTSQPW